MNTLVIDLEMNPVNYNSKPVCKPCLYEIIEIGAVLLDEENKEIDSFKTYVKPQYSDRVSNRIKDLTGIKYYMLSGAPGFSDALNELIEWAKGYGDYKIVTWSGSDKLQIEKETALKGYKNEEFMERIRNSRDIQIDYSTLSEEKQSVSLNKALCSLGITFDGSAHDALADAKNTCTLYSIIINPIEFKMLFNSVKAAIGTDSKESCVTIGNLIDFSAFNYAFA